MIGWNDEIAGWLRAELAPAGVEVLADPCADLTNAGGLAVVSLSSWTPALLADLAQRAITSEALVVPLRYDGGLTLVGPLLGSGLSGCVECAEEARLRTLGALPERPPHLAFGGIPLPAMLPMLASVVVDIASRPVDHAARLWAIRGSDATASVHRVRPRPGGCPLCMPLPADSPEAATFPLVPRPLPNPGVLRLANPVTEGRGLREELFDWRLGPVHQVFRSEGLPLALVTAQFTTGTGTSEGGYGRAMRVADAERIAFFEAAERHAGMRPHGRRTVLEASFAELGPDRAVDPARLGLHDPRYYRHPAFRLEPYDPDVPTRWVHGWSLTAAGPRAVPEHVAYWSLPPGHGTRFLYESSNGCGLGNSLEEAALYGLFEVAERDAFLMAWYAQTPLTRVAPPADDDMLPHLVDLLDPLGYELIFFDATNDFGIPAVKALALHRDPAAAAPQAFFAAGAHPDPRAALRSAAAEVAVDVFTLDSAVRNSPDRLDRDRLLGLLADSTEVRTLDDHVALHTLAEARPRYDFLLERAADPVDWRDVWPGRPAPVQDLTRLLDELVAHLSDAGMETVVVDQTDPWIRDRLGLYTVKVLVPGALPMTFGHIYHRTRGLPRLVDLPPRLGRAPAGRTYEDLPLYPHPFP